MKEITTLYKFGFKLDDVYFGWKNKKLYKLPYIKNNRSYQLKEIPFYCFKSTLVCNLFRRKYTINKLKQLTTEINIKVNHFEESECPF